MKKISSEEFSLLSGKDSSDKGENQRWTFYRAIKALHTDENLLISKKEWKGYRTPARICRYIMKKYPQMKYVWKKLSDGSGWAVKRVE